MTLLLTYSDIRLWRKNEHDAFDDSPPFPYERSPISALYDWRYERINALYLPTLKKHNPLDILVTFREIEKILPHFNSADENREYIWYIERFSNDGKRHFGLSDTYYKSFSFKKIEASLQGISPPGYGDEKEYVFYELQTLNRILELFLPQLSPWWIKSDPLVKLYLQNRAWDINKYGIPVADLTFPQPSIPGATQGQVLHMVYFMTKAFEKTLQRHEIKAVEKWKKEHAKEVEENFAKYMKHKIVPLPNLPLKALTPDNREAVKKACLNELVKNDQEGSNGKALLVVINEFVHFCELLRQPENLIKKPTGQYIEKEVPLRTVADMVNEMRGELISLPNYTAYAKIMQVENGNQRVAKIKTFKLREVGQSVILASIQQEILNQTYQDYCQKRKTIEREIRERQIAWQKELSEKPIPGREGDIKPEKPVKNEEASPPLPTRQH